MYTGHDRLCVSVSVCLSVCLCACLSLAAFPHYCTNPDVGWRNARGRPLVVHCRADLQSVHGFRCYDNIAPIAKFLYSLYAWFKIHDNITGLDLL